MADGSVLIFDIGQSACTARLAGFRGDVQSLTWALFQLPAPSGGAAAIATAPNSSDSEAGTEGKVQEDTTMPATPTFSDAGATEAAAREQLPLQADLSLLEADFERQQARKARRSLRAAHHADASKGSRGRQEAQLPEQQEAPATATAATAGACCDLLAAGARDSTLQIWDCK